MGELSKLPNIAAKLEAQLADVGITTAEELRNVGSREAWLRILARDPSACLMRLSALEGALRGVRWHYLDDETKQSLKAFYQSQKGIKSKQQQLLTDAAIIPDDEVLSEALSKSFDAYEMLLSKLADLAIGLEWRYYNDGKAWLGKAVHKKKTVFWLSAWDGFFKTTCYFTEKTRAGIAQLPIDERIKEEFLNETAKGKLIPLVLDISSTEQIPDLVTLIGYKRDVK